MASTNNPRRSQPRLSPQPSAEIAAAALPKGSTFHTPTGPSVVGDPVLDVRKLPRRAPTSPKGLHELLDGLNDRIGGMTISETTTASQARDDRPVNPSLVVKAQKLPRDRSGNSKDPFDVNHRADKVACRSNSDHSHDSDSGIGSSVSAESAPASPELQQRQRADLQFHQTSAFTLLGRPNQNLATSHKLGRRAADLIERLIVNPLSEQPRLESFHKLVKGIPSGIELGAITCLRDVEKYLVLQAPKRAARPASFLIFAETAIQCVHHTHRHLAGRDLVRPTDKPYSNLYFVDLIEQVRQYARIMEAHRLSTTHGKGKAKSMDVELNEAGLNEMGERIRLEGGISNDGKPLRLVREGANGEIIEIDARQQQLLDTEMEDGERSMARKRKCDIGKEVLRGCRECGKQFPRTCDLTKHEKTHTRPWKCSEPTCDYAVSGFATEKECDRHYNDKHDKDPKMYKCLYDNCNYMSKRESNCKQHMEKTHGWQYTRSKSKKDQEIKIPMIRKSELHSHLNTPMSMSAATPSSSNHGPSSVATPTSTHLSYSPVASTSNGVLSPMVEEPTGPSFQNSIFSDDFDFEDDQFGFASFGNALGIERSGSLDTEGMTRTPSSTVDFMSSSDSAPSDAITNFDFSWPLPDSYIGAYNNNHHHHNNNTQGPAQQPTPAYSDYKDFEMGVEAGLGEAPIKPQRTEAGLISPSSDAQFNGADDWALFSGPTGGDSSTASNQLFPELNDVENQFGMNEQLLDPMFGNAHDDYGMNDWLSNSQQQHQPAQQ